MKKNKKIEELLDRWEEGNMSVKDLSDELYILFAVSGRSELLLAFANELNEEAGFPLNSEGFEEFVNAFLSKQ